MLYNLFNRIYLKYERKKDSGKDLSNLEDQIQLGFKILQISRKCS